MIKSCGLNSRQFCVSANSNLFTYKGDRRVKNQGEFQTQDYEHCCVVRGQWRGICANPANATDSCTSNADDDRHRRPAEFHRQHCLADSTSPCWRFKALQRSD